MPERRVQLRAWRDDFHQSQLTRIARILLLLPILGVLAGEGFVQRCSCTRRVCRTDHAPPRPCQSDLCIWENSHHPSDVAQVDFSINPALIHSLFGQSSFPFISLHCLTPSSESQVPSLSQSLQPPLLCLPQPVSPISCHNYLIRLDLCSPALITTYNGLQPLFHQFRHFNTNLTTAKITSDFLTLTLPLSTIINQYNYLSLPWTLVTLGKNTLIDYNMNLNTNYKTAKTTKDFSHPNLII